MRLVTILAILSFISALFWTTLLDQSSLVICLALLLVFLLSPKFRYLAVIAASIFYFSFYSSLSLTGFVDLPSFFQKTLIGNEKPLQVFVDKREHIILVEIQSLINTKNRGYFNAKLISIDSIKLNYSPIIEMRWFKPDIDLQLGQSHKFKVVIKPICGRANISGFDCQKNKFSHHIAYLANIRKHISIVYKNESLRGKYYQKIVKLTERFSNQGMLLALSFADRSQITFKQNDSIRRLGVSHLFAISGLHIGLLFSFTFIIFNSLLLRSLPEDELGWHNLRYASLIALAAAFFYAYLAGFSYPTQRAFFMLFFTVLILQFKRKKKLLDILFFVLLLILIIDPLAVLSISLWLSFLAVSIITALIWFMPQINKHGASLKKGNSITHYIKLLVFLQIGLNLIMLPLQLISFSAISFAAPIVNLIAVPLFSLLIIPLTLLAVIFSIIFEPISIFLFSTASNLLDLFFYIFDIFLPGYFFTSESLNKIIISIMAIGCLGIFVCFHSIKIKKLFFCFTCLFIGYLSFSHFENKRYKKNEWFVEVIDVGQGLAVLVRSYGKTLLYDTGPKFPNGFATASTEIIPYLYSLGVKQLDYLVISHSDIDHSGGFNLIIDTFKPKNIYLGEKLRSSQSSNEIKVNMCHTGMSWKLGQLQVDVLSPFVKSKRNNDNSCVIRIYDEFNSLLLTGDIEKKQEIILVNKFQHALKSTILVAPHHGSKHSSSIEFIKAVDPKVVAFTAGFMNHWGFPENEVVKRYKESEIYMVNSGDSGFIRFKIEKEQIDLQTYREDLSNYWYHHFFKYK